MVAADGIQQDLAELTKLVSLATRPAVKDLLQKQIATTETLLKKAREHEELEKPKLVSDGDAAGDDIPLSATAGVGGSVREENLRFTEITTYELKKGKGFNEPTVVVDLRVKGVESLPKEAVTVDFTSTSMDVKIRGLALPPRGSEKGSEKGNYRFRKMGLQHDIVVGSSSFAVKKNHVLVTMQKAGDGAGSMGYETWSDLIGRRPSADKKAQNKSADPTASLMSMMKDMYEDGDDQTRKVIGEAMAKSFSGKPGLGKMDEDMGMGMM